MDDRIGVGFGWSNNPDAREAGREAAQTARVAAGGDVSLAFLFASEEYDADRLLEGARSALGLAPIHGGTSSTGLLGPAGFLSSPTGVVGVLALTTPFIEFGVGYAPLGDDPQAAGRAAAEMALQQPDVPGGPPEAVIVTATPGSEEAVLRGVAAVIGEDVPVVGGSAADNAIQGNWKVWGREQAFSAGVVVTLIYTHLPLGYAYGSGYCSTEKKATVTRGSGRRLYELDGRPAADVYAEWTGESREALAGAAILGKSLLRPVASETSFENFAVVKHPAVVNEDGSIDLFADVREGEVLFLVEASCDDLLAAVTDTVQRAMDMAMLEKEDVAAVYLVHCGGRRAALDDRIGEVADRVKKVAGDCPFISYLTFGEQGCLDSGRNVHGDLLLSALVIGK